MPEATIHTHCQVAQSQQHEPKLVKEYVCTNPVRQEMKKHGHTTMAIRNAGFGAKLKVHED